MKTLLSYFLIFSFIILTKQAFNCLKSMIETLEKVVKYVLLFLLMTLNR